MRRKRNSLVGKDGPGSRPTSMIKDEPLLDPQLAAMLEMRKQKQGESPGKLRKKMFP